MASQDNEQRGAGSDPWQAQLGALGAFIRAQRQVADLSLREMATLTQVSNAYLSQVERGLHQPSVKVMQQIAAALGLPFDTLLEQAGVTPRAAAEPAAEAGSDQPPLSEDAIRADPRLSDAQREALLGVLRSFLPPAEG